LAIDFLLFFLLFFPVTRLVKGVWLLSMKDHCWASGWFVSDPLCVLFLLFIFLYFTFLEGLLGETLGKRFLGLRVVRITGERPGLMKNALRNLLRFVDGLPAFNLIGILLILSSVERARFGDCIAGTRVVRLIRYSFDQ